LSADQKSMPPPEGIAGPAACFFGNSATMASVVIRNTRRKGSDSDPRKVLFHLATLAQVSPRFLLNGAGD
jgi:hypothetical protein